MSIAKNARASQVARNVNNGSYIAIARFAGYDEATEGIMAQQREADLKLQKILANKKAKTKSA